MPKFAPKQILCPVDMSPASSAVLGWARLIAEAFASRVEILYADWSEPPRYFTESQLDALDSEEQRERQMLDRVLQDLGQRVLGPHVSFTVSVVEGHAVDVILGRLRNTLPDLVVMGSRGRSGVRGWKSAVLRALSMGGIQSERLKASCGSDDRDISSVLYELESNPRQPDMEMIPIAGAEIYFEGSFLPAGKLPAFSTCCSANVHGNGTDPPSNTSSHVTRPTMEILTRRTRIRGASTHLWPGFRSCSH